MWRHGNKRPVHEFLLLSSFRLEACNFIKRRIWHRQFPVNFAKFLRTPILQSICEKVSLNFVNVNLSKIQCQTPHDIMMKCLFVWRSYSPFCLAKFNLPITQFSLHTQACFDNLCMNRTALDRVSWNSTTCHIGTFLQQILLPSHRNFAAFRGHISFTTRKLCSGRIICFHFFINSTTFSRSVCFVSVSLESSLWLIENSQLNGNVWKAYY